MRKKNANLWCGLLLLLSSFPVVIWCGGEVPDTTTAAAVASKLTPVSPPPTSSVNSSLEQAASKLASATVSVLTPRTDFEPAAEQQTEVSKIAIEELHSSFEEAAEEPTEPGLRPDNEKLSETLSAALPAPNTESSDSSTTSTKILSAEDTLATVTSSLLLEPPHNDSLPSENNVTEIVHEAETEDIAQPHVPESTPSATSTPAPNEPAPEEQEHQERSATNHTDGEEIPSFSEWAQKQLEEAEKRKVQNASEPPKAPPKPVGNLKLRSKNFASPDCGAKITAANPEAQSVSSVLSPSRDEYALNPCTSAKIWFVVELCEAVQAKQVDLANFELFSSSPKDFTVWVSDRFPTREWHSVGQFTAQDERNVQSFNLEPHLFAKFMRIELHSHWGSEHFCPVSLLRVYGVSEFEVLADEEGHPDSRQPDEEGEEELVTVPGGDAPKNLFGSARDAVISMVKKAAQVLVKTGDSKNMTNSEVGGDEFHCDVTPLPNSRNCIGCSPRVLSLLACRGEDLQTMLASPFVARSLQQEGICQGYRNNDSYLAALLPEEYLTALCHLLPTFSNHHHTTATYDNLTIAPHDPFILLQPSETPSTCSIPSSSEIFSHETATKQQGVPITDSSTEIRPTKTLKEQESSEQFHSTGLAEPELVVTENVTVEDEGDAWKAVETILSEETEVDTPTTPAPLVIPPVGQASSPPGVAPPAVPPTPGHTTTQSPQASVTVQVPPPTQPTQAMNVHATQSPSQQPVLVPQPTAPQQQQQQVQQQGQQKESVFVRLANRIKALERNMSLSAQYLEELSKRYKKQVEEMQRAFERTLTAVGEASRQATQREVQHAESLAALEQRLGALAATTAALMAERDSWHFKFTVLSQHVLLFAAIIWFVLLLVRQCSPAHREEVSPEPLKVRRHSVEPLAVLTTSHRKRRPSTEAGASPTPPNSAPPTLSSPFIFKNPTASHERRGSHITEWRMDPSRKKRRRLRRELRGVSVEELCSGLSPATLAAVRPRPAPQPQPLSSPRSTEPNRRHSTESSPLMVRSSMQVVNNIPSDPEPPNMFNGPVENIPASPCVQQRKTGGLRKMVRKLF